LKSESPWVRLSEFISKIKKDVETPENEQNQENQFGPAKKLMSGGMLFTKGELGTLILTPDDTTEFQSCVNAIHELVSQDNRTSTHAVEDTIEIAVLKAIDIRCTDSESDFAKRLAREIDEAKESFKRKLDTYLVRLEVQGISTTGLPVQFGGIKFYVADENSMPELNDGAETKDNSADEVRKKLIESNRTFRDNIVASVKGKIYAEIEVEAFDLKAAGYLAESQLRLTLDVLNYFNDFFSREGAKVFLPGEATTVRHVAVVGKKGDTKSQRFELSHKGPIFRFSFPLSNAPAKNGEAFEKASALLTNRNRNSLDKRILAAIQWAGRASTDDRDDKAFLHFCISLEALLVKKEDRGEIAFSFALRGAHLLAKDASMRQRIFDDLGSLYRLRSKVVHEGKTNISDTDLARIQLFAKNAIFIVLVTDPFSSMTTIDNLEDWFMKQQLSGVQVVKDQTGD
jgi:hypothetical protein